MSDADLLDALHAALGPEALEAHEPRVVDGEWVEIGVRPADAAGLGEALRVLSARGAGTVVWGSGGGLALGNPPRAARVWLGLSHLAGVDELDLEEGVLHARAGTPLAAVAAALEGSGWEAPFDPPGAGSTLGGTLATAAAGPRRVAFGAPRDRVLGLEVALGDGVRTRCGGRVVKNVTGYDLMKLQIGALGTLGVIEGAWIRLRAAPETVRVLAGTESDRERALAAALAAARAPSARAAALLSAPRARALGAELARPGADAIVVELGGEARTVAADAERLGALAGLAEAPAELVAALRDLQGGSDDETALGFRVSGRPSRLGRTMARLEAAGGELLVYAGDGTIFARFSRDGDGDGRIAAAWRAAREAAREGEGAAVLESGPRGAKRGRDVFGESPAHLPLLRAVKARFDPAGILNPGRFVGGI